MEIFRGAGQFEQLFGLRGVALLLVARGAYGRLLRRCERYEPCRGDGALKQHEELFRIGGVQVRRVFHAFRHPQFVHLAGKVERRQPGLDAGAEPFAASALLDDDVHGAHGLDVFGLDHLRRARAGTAKRRAVVKPQHPTIRFALDEEQDAGFVRLVDPLGPVGGQLDTLRLQSLVLAREGHAKTREHLFAREVEVRNLDAARRVAQAEIQKMIHGQALHLRQRRDRHFLAVAGDMRSASLVSLSLFRHNKPALALS